jgi:hypothetical protein
MLEHPEVTIRAVAVGGLLLALYGGAATLLAHRQGLRLRWDETLTLGACLTILVGCLAGFAARALLALETRTALPAPSLDLGLASALLVLVPVAIALALLRPRTFSIDLRSMARRAAPPVALIVTATALVTAIGVHTLFRTDSDRRARAVKELVWANSIVSTGADPSLPAENSKYSGYLASRAMVTRLAATDPWAPSLAWIMIAATGLAAGLVALVRNLGLPAWSAGVALAAMPLLGGDSYRLPLVGEPRAVSALLLIGGLALVARGLVERSRWSWWLAAVGGAIIGASALSHVQYAVITGSVLGPTLVLVLALRKWWEVPARPLLLASAVATALLCLGLLQGRALVGSSSLAETAAERREGEGVTDKKLLTSGRSVWPPRSVTVNGVRLLYVSPSLYVLHPRALIDGVWGERTSALLGLTGLAGALLLRRRASPLLVPLMTAAVLVPVAVLFNPVFFPYFDRHFAAYRAEYIGFELSFVGIAAVAAAVAVHRTREMILPVVVLVAAVPVVHATFNWHRTVHREYRSIERNPWLLTFRELQRWARYADLLVASQAATRHATGFQTTSLVLDARSITPNPLDAGAEPGAALRSLSRIDVDRVIVVLDETTPRAAPIHRLIAAGRIDSAGGTDDSSGIYWIRVELPEYAREGGGRRRYDSSRDVSVADDRFQRSFRAAAD